MIRSTASDVSALSGFVANDCQTLRDVSFSPSEIPYGGFSPVRLQIGRRPRPSPTAHTRRRLIRGPSRYDRSPSVAPCGAIAAQSRRSVNERFGVPIQRPLAHPRVILSRRVVAYYGLIRGSGFLPTPYGVSAAGLCLVEFPPLRLGTRDSPIYSARPLLRAVSRTPADQVALTVVVPPAAAFAHSREARHPLVFHAEVSSRVGHLTRLQSSLYAAARSVAGPPLTEDFYSRAFIPPVARMERRL
jgi:hypothetical protein